MNSLWRTSLLVLLAAACSGRADEGGLKHTLEVRDVQGGFAGFTGRMWAIDPSGEWRTGRVFNQKVDMVKKGQATKKQLAALVKALEDYDLATLTSSKEDRPQANPHVVTILYGKKELNLTLLAGEPLPMANPKKPKAFLTNRYAGIAQALQEIATEKKE